MTIAKVAPNGRLRVFNPFGDVDVVIDVTAVFT